MTTKVNLKEDKKLSNTIRIFAHAALKSRLSHDEASTLSVLATKDIVNSNIVISNKDSNNVQVATDEIMDLITMHGGDHRNMTPSELDHLYGTLASLPSLWPIADVPVDKASLISYNIKHDLPLANMILVEDILLDNEPNMRLCEELLHTVFTSKKVEKLPGILEQISDRANQADDFEGMWKKNSAREQKGWVCYRWSVARN